MARGKQKTRLGKASWIIRKAGQILQVGGVRAFTLYQVIGALGNLELTLEEIGALSRAIASFENLARLRLFKETLRGELSGGEWQATFRKVG